MIAGAVVALESAAALYGVRAGHPATPRSRSSPRLQPAAERASSQQQNRVAPAHDRLVTAVAGHIVGIGRLEGRFIGRTDAAPAAVIPMMVV